MPVRCMRLKSRPSSGEVHCGRGKERNLALWAALFRAGQHFSAHGRSVSGFTLIPVLVPRLLARQKRPVF